MGTRQPTFAKHDALVADTPTPIVVDVDGETLIISNRGDGAASGAVEVSDLWVRVNGDEVTAAEQDDTYWVPFGGSVEVSSRNPGSADVVHLWSAGATHYSIEVSNP